MKTDGRAGIVRTGLAVATGVALAAVVLLVDGPFVDVKSPVGILTVLVLWAGPAAVYRFAVRTFAGSVFVGLLLVLAAPLLLRAVIETDGSTAALGVLFVPMTLWAGVAVAVLLEALVSQLARERRR